MSKLTANEQRPSRRRADAEHSITAILDAAVRLLSERPEASLEEIARAAGVTRQTVYAHYRSREAVVSAAVDRVSDEAVATMDAVQRDDAPPTTVLLGLVTAGWRTYERHRRLLQMSAQDPAAEQRRHDPVREHLHRVIKRGQDDGDFDCRLPPSWLATVAMALGHAAAEDVAAGRMPISQASTAIEHSTLRVVGAEPRSAE